MLRSGPAGPSQSYTLNMVCNPPMEIKMTFRMKLRMKLRMTFSMTLRMTFKTQDFRGVI